jgi:chromosome segregation ATPase
MGMFMNVMTKAEAARQLSLSQTWIGKMVKNGDLASNEEGKVFVEAVEKEKAKRETTTLVDVFNQTKQEHAELQTAFLDFKLTTRERELVRENEFLLEITEVHKQLAVVQRDLGIAQAQAETVKAESTGWENLCLGKDLQISQLEKSNHGLEADKKKLELDIEELKEELKAARIEAQAYQNTVRGYEKQKIWQRLLGVEPPKEIS